MAVEVGDILRISANMLFEGTDQYSNIFHFQISQNDSASDDNLMEDIALEMDTSYTLVEDDISDDVAFVDVEGINITQDVLLPPKGWPVLTTGNDPIQALPGQVSACVYFRTLRPRTRASKFMPPYGEDRNESGGVIGATAIARLQQFGDFWVVGLNSLDVKGKFGAYNREFDRFTEAKSAVVPIRFRTQRRRRVGVGS